MALITTAPHPSPLPRSGGEGAGKRNARRRIRTGFVLFPRFRERGDRSWVRRSDLSRSAPIPVKISGRTSGIVKIIIVRAPYPTDKDPVTLTRHLDRYV